MHASFNDRCVATKIWKATGTQEVRLSKRQIWIILKYLLVKFLLEKFYLYVYYVPMIFLSALLSINLLTPHINTTVV